jgi:hypothetical protein
MNAARVASAALLALLATTGCVGPSRTDDDYARKAANTAEAVRSSVNTVRVGAHAVRQDRITGPYLSRLVAEAEEDAQAAQQAFDSVQPPSVQSDALHQQVDEVVQDALDLLRVARIAVRRGNLAEVARLDDRLQKAAEDLEALENA